MRTTVTAEEAAAIAALNQTVRALVQELHSLNVWLDEHGWKEEEVADDRESDRELADP